MSKSGAVQKNIFYFLDSPWWENIIEIAPFVGTVDALALKIKCQVGKRKGAVFFWDSP